MALFQIVAQKQVTKPSPAGGWTECMEVRFVTTSGVPGSVCVPIAQYNADTVAAMINQRVAEIDAVNRLGD